MRKALVAISIVLSFYIVFLINCKGNNQPDAPSVPIGPASGGINTTYRFSTVTVDPEGNDISYQFDWGNSDTSVWSSFIPSGDSIVRAKFWVSPGSYSIRARAKDGRGKISNWSGAHPIALTSVWRKTYGGIFDDGGNSVQSTSDGGYIIAGMTESYGAGLADIYLIKTNSGGNTVWTKTFGTWNKNENSYCVEQTTDGGYIIVGIQIDTIHYYNNYNIYLVRTDANGNDLWTRTFDLSYFDLGLSVEQTADGGYIIAGSTVTADSAFPKVVLIKTNANGNIVWTRTYDSGTGFGFGNCVQQTTDGGYIVVGSTVDTITYFEDVYLIKTDANGNKLWSETYGGYNSDWANWVRQTTDGGYIIAGTSESYGAGGADLYLIKTNATGTINWTKSFGGVGQDFGSSVQQTTDGGYVFCGYTGSFGAGSDDIYLIKTNSNGDSVWSKTYGGAEADIGGDVRLTADGGYIIAGKTYSYGAGEGDVYLIKTDGSGNTAQQSTTSKSITKYFDNYQPRSTILIEYVKHYRGIKSTIK